MQLWFLATLVTFPVAHSDGDDGISSLESRVHRGDSAPYRVHRGEDEVEPSTPQGGTVRLP